jgi:hypothetical protein
MIMDLIFLSFLHSIHFNSCIYLSDTKVAEISRQFFILDIKLVAHRYR